MAAVGTKLRRTQYTKQSTSNLLARQKESSGGFEAKTWHNLYFAKHFASSVGKKGREIAT
jgi:hypothetical protein